MTLGDHFDRVAASYDSLRTTDIGPVRRVRQLLPDRPLIGVDVGCGTGRYSRLLGELLPAGSLLVASDVSAAMLAELKAANDGHAPVLPLRSTSEDLALRTGSVDLVTAFNCVHHFDLGCFLAGAARVLQPDGQLFVYTRTPEQNARTVWGCYFPGFAQHEQRLHSAAKLQDAVQRTDGLELVDTHAFRHLRSSTPERLKAQAEAHHYSTFSLYAPDELRAAIATFLARLPGPEISWVDEHLLVVARRCRFIEVEADEFEQRCMAEPVKLGQTDQRGIAEAAPLDRRLVEPRRRRRRWRDRRLVDEPLRWCRKTPSGTVARVALTSRARTAWTQRGEQPGCVEALGVTR